MKYYILLFALAPSLFSQYESSESDILSAYRTAFNWDKSTPKEILLSSCVITQESPISPGLGSLDDKKPSPSVTHLANTDGTPTNFPRILKPKKMIDDTSDRSTLSDESISVSDTVVFIKSLDYELRMEFPPSHPFVLYMKLNIEDSTKYFSITLHFKTSKGKGYHYMTTLFMSPKLEKDILGAESNYQRQYIIAKILPSFLWPGNCYKVSIHYHDRPMANFYFSKQGEKYIWSESENNNASYIKLSRVDEESPGFGNEVEADTANSETKNLEKVLYDYVQEVHRLDHDLDSSDFGANHENAADISHIDDIRCFNMIKCKLFKQRPYPDRDHLLRLAYYWWTAYYYVPKSFKVTSTYPNIENNGINFFKLFKLLDQATEADLNRRTNFNRTLVSILKSCLGTLVDLNVFRPRHVEKLILLIENISLESVREIFDLTTRRFHEIRWTPSKLFHEIIWT